MATDRDELLSGLQAAERRLVKEWERCRASRGMFILSKREDALTAAWGFWRAGEDALVRQWLKESDW